MTVLLINFAHRTEEWLKKNALAYWGKGIWPGNSPDLNPIKNLWAILQNKLDNLKTPPSNIQQLEHALKEAWSEISPETLSNLIESMPERIKKVLETDGKEYVL